MIFPSQKTCRGTSVARMRVTPLVYSFETPLGLEYRFLLNTRDTLLKLGVPAGTVPPPQPEVLDSSHKADLRRRSHGPLGLPYLFGTVGCRDEGQTASLHHHKNSHVRVFIKAPSCFLFFLKKEISPEFLQNKKFHLRRNFGPIL